MMTIEVRLYEELNQRQPPHRTKKRFAMELPKGSTVDTLLHSLEIPADRVELALVNGSSVPGTHALHHGDDVSLYPVFESMNLGPILRFRDRPLRSVRFLTDQTAHDLAGLLRGAGLDVRHEPVLDDRDLVRLSVRERRVLLSTRPELVRAPELTHALLIPKGIPRVQLAHVLDRLDLDG